MDDSGPGSLRQAILDANASGVSSTINFDIPSAGAHMIAPLSPLPDVAVPVLIDGRTQPGYAGTPIVELDGTSAGPANGLTLAAGFSTVRGLAITWFNQNGIELRGLTNVITGNYIGLHLDGSTLGRNFFNGILVTDQSSHNLIGVGSTNAEDRNVISGNGRHGIALQGLFGVGADHNFIFGNYIGTSANGSASVGNALSGIYVTGSDNIIGASAPLQRNVISANGATGIDLNARSDHSTIQGNYIGTDATGSVALGNYLGISIISEHNLIGGPNAGKGNLISANATDGISLTYVTGLELAAENVIQGNYIGTDAAGTGPLGNLQHGIAGYRTYQENQIGGTGPWPMGNVIAFNGGAGTTVAFRNPKLGNSIHDNGLLGIDFNGGTPLLNDPGDTDFYQNYPIIRSAILRASTTDFNVEFSSRPNTTYRLEFFLSAHCDPSGFGEGESLILVISVTTDAGGDAFFTTSFPFALPLGNVVTATATSPVGNTSEFSPCAYVYPPDYLVFTHVVHHPDEGDGTMTMELARESGGQEMTVKYRSISGTAKEGRNYLPTSGTLTVLKGETNAFFKVQLVDNDLIEGPKSFQAQLSNPQNSLEIWSTAFVLIEDNDGPLKLQSSMQSNVLALCWTTNAVGYELQYSPTIDNSDAWQPMTNAAALEGTNWCVTTSFGDPSGFYRLRQQ